MITRAQSHKLQKEAILAVRPKLSATERGMLTWSMLDPGDKVLDANLHSGLMLEYMARNMECEICGISNDMERVRQARSRLQNADIVYACPEDIPWRENSFDAVFFHPSKHRDTDFDASFREILRVLKPGGQFLLGVQRHPAFLSPLIFLRRWEGKDSQGSGIQRRGAWMEALSSAGYHDVTWRQTDLTKGIAIGWKPIHLEMKA